MGLLSEAAKETANVAKETVKGTGEVAQESVKQTGNIAKEALGLGEEKNDNKENKAPKQEEKSSLKDLAKEAAGAFGKEAKIQEGNSTPPPAQEAAKNTEIGR